VEQLAKEVKQLYGITLPLITTFGCFWRNGLLKSVISLKPNGVVFVHDTHEIRCSVCDRPIIGEQCSYTETPHYGNYSSLCKFCFKMSVLYLQQKWVKLYDKLQLYELLKAEVVQKEDGWVPSSEFYEMCKAVKYMDALPCYTFPTRLLCQDFVLGFQFERILKLVHRRRIIITDFRLNYKMMFLGTLRKFVRGFRQGGTVLSYFETCDPHTYPYREMFFSQFSPCLKETSDRYLRPDGLCNYYRFFLEN